MQDSTKLRRQCVIPNSSSPQRCLPRGWNLGEPLNASKAIYIGSILSKPSSHSHPRSSIIR